LLQLFAAEIVNWDREQERKLKVATEECQDGVLIGDDPECQIIELNTDLTSSHGLLAQDLTRRALATLVHRGALDKHRAGGGSSSAASLLVSEICQMVEAVLVEEPAQRLEEPRLISYVHYLSALKVKDEVMRRALLEQVANSGLLNSSDVSRLVIQEARDLLVAEASPAVLEESKKWHRAYHNFRCPFVNF
jgi:hypothetical protein